ncbi:unnamed protein product [Paramecium pentaurelia]|uniref:MORN repeat protein n=1 Tax=Paramecium pentaurelia TaxID=43138 RepID=A0A8S1YF08_9CILI|nr:unnamed protein product [Paramecium pentaurelia]
MGCVSTKDQHIKQFNIKLPDSINQTTLQTDLDLSDSLDQYMQIGMNLSSIGELHPKVQLVHQELGDLFPNLQGQYLLMPDQSIYFGQTLNGKRNGQGKQHWQKEGNLLEGIWIDNQLNGRARMIYPNGDYFDGNFVNNVANGIGKFVNSRKEVRGFWLNNKLIGEGTEIRKNGTIYTGQFQDGKIHGQGKFEFANGCVYKGNVQKGKMHGNGELIFYDNTRYVGEFRNNCIQGRGIYEASIPIHGWFHSKYENQTIFLYFFRQETPVLVDNQDCTLIQKQLSTFFD